MSLPIPNLDDKTFEELVEEVKKLIPIYAPGWTDHNVHDPGITFIELFAWLAEMQIYRLNRVPDRSYRKFLKLMGIPKLKPARAAEVDLTFSLRTQQPSPVPAGTQVAAKDPISGEDIIFESRVNLSVVDAELKEILSHPKSRKFIKNTEANRNENVYYYAFRNMPETGDELYLGFNKSLTDQEVTLAFYLYEGELSRTSRYDEENPEVYPSATLSWEYYIGGNWEDEKNWKRLEIIKDETRYLTRSDKIWFKIKEEMGQTGIGNANNLFWLRCKIDAGGYEIPPKIDFIRLNTVSAIQSVTLDEYKFSSTGLPDFYVNLGYTPVVDKTLKVKEEDSWIEWSEVDDFDASNPGDRHYTVDLGSGQVTFGDGINGKIPPEGKDNIIISYRVGGGVRGNVGAHTICTMINEQLDQKVTVDNIKAASGGEEAETLEEAIIRVKKDLKTVYRAVTSADYEHLAKNTPGLRIARAKAVPRYHPSQDNEVPGIVTIIVVPHSPYDNPKPSEGFLKTVYRHLDKHRLLTTELFVIPPEYIEVTVKATVVLKPKSEPSRVKEDVKEELRNFLNPITGGVDRTGWPFGRSVYRSELYEIIDRVEGVDYVKFLNLKKNEGAWQDSDIHIPAHCLVYSGSHIIGAKEEREV